MNIRFHLFYPLSFNAAPPTTLRVRHRIFHWAAESNRDRGLTGSYVTHIF
jgi:hypothetical protein